MNPAFPVKTLYDPVAQSAEHLPFKQGVRGSNPRWVTNLACATCAQAFLFAADRILHRFACSSHSTPAKPALEVAVAAAQAQRIRRGKYPPARSRRDPGSVQLPVFIRLAGNLAVPCRNPVHFVI